MKFILGFVSSVSLFPIKLLRMLFIAPFKVFAFMFNNALIFGLIAAIRLLIKSIIKIFTKPLFLGMVLGGTLVFMLIDAQRRKKVFAMIGL
ncbi:MAG: hypothetical protein JW920_10345 [Deltaproteobacteria bacterium]|nr:hypothetical protein [Deltaproteobacteria bacterium]